MKKIAILAVILLATIACVSPSTPAIPEVSQQHPTATPIEEISAEVVKNLLAVKHQQSLVNTILTVEKQTDNHMRGGVSFLGEQGGGLFLAAKKDGEWVLVFDGNGSYSCATVKEFGFPQDMVEDCAP